MLFFLNSYGFVKQNVFTQKGTKDIVNWLSANYFVIDVQKEKEYQKKDIDLITVDKHNIHHVTTLEIKCDSYYKTGNYFAETISNKQKYEATHGTEGRGCWTYTESDYILYYFPDAKELHIIPTSKAQEWTKAHIDTLPVKHLATQGDDGNKLYDSEGVLIKREQLKKEIGVEVVII